MPPTKVIIDTDPGVDDVLALLLAFAATPEELEILLVSVTYGNVEVDTCLRNVVSLFHILEKEMAWRKAQGQPEGFTAMLNSEPIVAVGADHPLEDDILMADYFHGLDGLAGVHTTHPHLSPSDAWRTLFRAPQPSSSAEEVAEAKSLATPPTLFQASQIPAHKEILRLLRENPLDTVTIVAVGPLTNLALAAAEDTETFLRVKEVVVMGGTIDIPGNVTPCAEFNTFADAVATARVFALTSQNPTLTMPLPLKQSSLPSYAGNLSRPLNLTLFPLDVTTPHTLRKSHFAESLDQLIKAGSPLAEWTTAFVQKTIEKIVSLSEEVVDPGLELHDPLPIWYLLSRSSPRWTLAPKAPEDIRVETAGQWTRGMYVLDKRNRKKIDYGSEIGALPTNSHGDAPGDNGGWLNYQKGNRINRIVGTPGTDDCGPYLIERVFGHIPVGKA